MPCGYEHYEISNFARLTATGGKSSPFRSAHNSNYWKDVPYIGIGAAAHSYDMRERSWNIADIKEYIRIAKTGRRPVGGSEVIDTDTHYNDIVTTALRTREGICLNDLYGEQREYLLGNARQMRERGLLAVSGDNIHLTRKGIFVSDSVMAELIKA